MYFSRAAGVVLSVYVYILSVAFCAGQRYLCYLSEVCYL